MQRGSYDLQAAEAGVKDVSKEDSEGRPLLEMDVQGTCTLKEIIEGEAEEPETMEKTEEGGAAKGSAKEDDSEVSEKEDEDKEEEEDDEENDEKREEVTKNGGDEVPKADYVGLEVEPAPRRSSNGQWKAIKDCKIPIKFLWVIIVMLILIIFFMAIAWPKQTPAAGSSSGIVGTTPKAEVPSSTSTSTPTTEGNVTTDTIGEADGTSPLLNGPTTQGQGQPDGVENETGKLLNPTCVDSSCWAVARRMFAYMDSEADACEDFYSYACGGMTADGGQWISEPDPDSKIWSAIRGSMETISLSGMKVFDDFYRSCVEYENVTMQNRIAAARKELDKVGKFYSKGESVTMDIVTELLANLLNRKFNPFWEVNLGVDSRDSSKFALVIYPLSYESWFGDATGIDLISQCKKVAEVKPKEGTSNLIDAKYEAYKECLKFQVPKYIEGMKKVLQSMNVTENTDWTFLEDMLTKMPSMPKATAKKELESNTLTGITSFKNFNSVDWKSLAKKLTGNDIPGDTEVQIYYGSILSDWLNDTETLAASDFNNALMALYATDLFYNLVFHPACQQEDHCLKKAVNLMPEAASALFLQSFPPEDLSTYHEKINSIFFQIKTSLESELDMSKDTTASSTTKIGDIEIIADGGRSIFLNNAKISELYKDYNYEDTYVEKAVSLAMMNQKRIYSSYDKNPSDPDQIWLHFLHPYSNRGKAIVKLNKVVIPYGMLEKEFLGEDSPSYLQVARLGQVIAKGIWKIYREKGISQNNVTGLSNRLEECLQSGFLDNDESGVTFSTSVEKPQILNDLIDFVRKRDGSTYKDDLLDERLAVCLAYWSIWRNPESNDIILPSIDLPPKKLFFLAMAQTSCTKSQVRDVVSTVQDLQLPPAIRVNAITRDLKVFNEVFSCPPSTRDYSTSEDTLKPSSDYDDAP